MTTSTIRLILLSLALAGAATAAIAAGGGESRSGEVVVLITDHREAIEDFSSLTVRFDGACLHQRGRPADSGWVEIDLEPQAVDLTRYVDGATYELASATVPVGRYDGAAISAAEVVGVPRQGTAQPVPFELSPVRVDLEVAEDRLTRLTFDVVVLDMRDHPGDTWNVMLKEVRVAVLSR